MNSAYITALACVFFSAQSIAGSPGVEANAAKPANQVKKDLTQRKVIVRHPPDPFRYAQELRIMNKLNSLFTAHVDGARNVTIPIAPEDFNWPIDWDKQQAYCKDVWKALTVERDKRLKLLGEPTLSVYRDGEEKFGKRWANTQFERGCRDEAPKSRFERFHKSLGNCFYDYSPEWALEVTTHLEHDVSRRSPLILPELIFAKPANESDRRCETSRLTGYPWHTYKNLKQGEWEYLPMVVDGRPLWVVFGIYLPLHAVEATIYPWWHESGGLPLDKPDAAASARRSGCTKRNADATGERATKQADSPQAGKEPTQKISTKALSAMFSSNELALMFDNIPTDSEIVGTPQVSILIAGLERRTSDNTRRATQSEEKWEAARKVAWQQLLRRRFGDGVRISKVNEGYLLRDSARKIVGFISPGTDKRGNPTVEMNLPNKSTYIVRHDGSEFHTGKNTETGSIAIVDTRTTENELLESDNDYYRYGSRRGCVGQGFVAITSPDVNLYQTLALVDTGFRDGFYGVGFEDAKEGQPGYGYGSIIDEEGWEFHHYVCIVNFDL